MRNDDETKWGTRRLEPQDIDPAVPGEHTEPLDYALPWVIELRIVGTPSVIQAQIKDELVIGRADPRDKTEPEIDLEAFNAYQYGVSRRHAAIFPRNNRLMVRDLGSANGTQLNGRVMQKGQDYRLRHGDTLAVGKLQLQVLFAVMPSSVDATEKTRPASFTIPTLGQQEPILLVDNDADVAYVLGSVLEQAGFKVTIVKTFAQAVSEIDKHKPAAIIFELLLPDMNGLELVRYVRDQMQSNMPLLVISSATAGFQMGQAIEAGVDVFMCKPVGIDELMRGMSKVVEQLQSA